MKRRSIIAGAVVATILVAVSSWAQFRPPVMPPPAMPPPAMPPPMDRRDEIPGRPNQGIEKPPRSDEHLRPPQQRPAISERSTVEKYADGDILRVLRERYGPIGELDATSPQVRTRYEDELKDRVFLRMVSNGLLDPRIVRGVSGRTPGDIQLASVAGSDPELMKLLNATADRDAVIALLTKGRSNVQVVLPGTNVGGTPPSLGAVPNPTAGLALPSADVRVTPGNRLAVPVYASGFQEIVLIGYSDIAHCTGVLLAPRWVMTAAHCVTRIGSTTPFADYKTALAVYLPASGGTASIRLGTLKGPSANRQGGFQKYEVLNLKIMAGWIGTATADIVLLELRDGMPPGWPNAAIYSRTFTSPVQITLVGFGLSETEEGATVGNNFGAGWQTAILDSDPARSSVLYWSYEITSKRPSSNICSGDSGGPVYFGTHRGLTGEKHSILAVNSRITECKSGDAFVTLITDDARRWICRETNGAAVDGCLN